MMAFLLSAALTAGVGAPEEKTTAPNIEGKWLIVYVEEGGKRNATWEQQVATVKGDTLSYSKDGDEHTLKLTFAPHQTVKAAASGGKGKDVKTADLHGVYVAAQDYLCLSLNPAGKGPSGENKSSADFILILRRQR